MSNAQLFSAVAREYANFRPGYPSELFAWLAKVSAGREAVWDCGCGSGQASLALAAHFSQVFATDASPAQIAAARPHPLVRYSVAPAENTGLASQSVDLVTVAQALHWFDLPAFYEEARRVARPGALLAVWTYPRPQFVDEGLERCFVDFYDNVVGPFWPPERRHVEAGYRMLPFPFEELEAPAFGLELRWNREQVLGYVSSWSATARYREARHQDPVPLLRDALADVWGGEPLATVRMPIAMRAGKVVR
jgi:SAM-dependent methyltransferase